MLVQEFPCFSTCELIGYVHCECVQSEKRNVK